MYLIWLRLKWPVFYINVYENVTLTFFLLPIFAYHNFHICIPKFLFVFQKQKIISTYLWLLVQAYTLEEWRGGRWVRMGDGGEHIIPFVCLLVFIQDKDVEKNFYAKYFLFDVSLWTLWSLEQCIKKVLNPWILT